MFGVIKKLGNNMVKLSTNMLISEIISEPSIQAQIIDLNQDQMLIKGVDAEGDSLGNYSKTSIEVYGKRPGRITLKDTGEFYDSMRITNGTEGFKIYGDMEKEGHDLHQRWPHALGLTKESIGEIIPEVKERLIDKILTKALR